MVVFGTWGCLNAGVKDPDAWRSGLVAIGGAVLMVAGIVMSGALAGFVAKSRRILGGIGLVIAPIAGLLSLLELGTRPSQAIVPLTATFVALALWGQAIALQAEIPIRVAASWIALTLAFAAVALPIAAGMGAAAATAATSFGLSSKGAAAAGFSAGAGGIAAVLAAWARHRPDRRSVPGAVRRAMFGHAVMSDRELLAAGPGRVLRRHPPTDAEIDAGNARLAALDRRLDPGDRGATAAPDDRHPNGGEP
jgi:hypothetical protein